MLPHTGPPETTLYIGLISGTSIDAADAALVDLADDRGPRLIATKATHPDAGLRHALLKLSQSTDAVSLSELGELDQRTGYWLADAALGVMDKAGVNAREVAAIGSHGQTVRHAPDARYPFSLQIGAPSVIAARTACPVIADFRSSDVALGGQGAPLVCAFHYALFSHPRYDRVVVNIGGIANVTVIPAGAESAAANITGFDTGPGNALMDAWIGVSGEVDFDRDGVWAARGTPDDNLLTEMLGDAYVRRPPPKSTGREYFNLDWLRAMINHTGHQPTPVDVQASLCEFTARSIIQAVDQAAPKTDEIILCGGGAHNGYLRARLKALAAPRTLTTTAAYGIDPDHVESATFAWLARQTIYGLAGNMTAVTGARAPAPLGAIYQPPLAPPSS